MAKSESSLLADARALTGGTGPRSKVHIVADDMDPKLRAEFAAALADTDHVSAAGLSKALAKQGISVSRASIEHFRQQGHAL